MSNFVVNTTATQQQMLQEINSSWEKLFAAVPDQLRSSALDLESGQSELAVRRQFAEWANANTVYTKCFLGAGSYRHYIPSVVNALAGRQEFLTAYTPYQPEISQGILQAIFEYQSMICELTGLDASNASVYDGATACAEAINMCRSKGKQRMLVAETLNPQYKAVIKTYFQFSDIEIVEIPMREGRIAAKDMQGLLDEETMGVLLQSPNYYGVFENCSELRELIKAHSLPFVLCANPLSFAVSANAKELGADICVGEAQPLGLDLAFGGPYLGYMACSNEYLRRLPGRIVGRTTDSNNNRAYVLTLQAREQHIRRERATSSICSNQANCALRCAIYLAAVGPKGLREVAWQSYQKAHFLADKLQELPGFSLRYNQPFFNEFAISNSTSSDTIIKKLRANNILPGLKLSDSEMLWCATECNSEDEILEVVSLIKEVI